MKGNQKILFRVDSSFTIGTGHIMRDFVLAKQLDGANITFATQDLVGNINHKIQEQKYLIEILNSNELDELIALINKLEIDKIVIDHYGIDYKFEKNLKERTNIEIMVFDDTYEKHHCDTLLNHNISADEKKYDGLVPHNCELQCGSQYTLLREEFIEEKKKKTIFLAMGGADSANLNVKILKVLESFSNIEVNVVSTMANQNLDELQEFTKDKAWINVHINSNTIAKLMKQSDFAIITPSVTANEAYFMELPFIAIQTAENQQDMYDYLVKNNYHTLKEFSSIQLKQLIESIIIKLDIQLINFINLSLNEKKMVLKWRNHNTIKQWMYTQKEISLENHLNYINTLTTRTDKVYFLVKMNEEFIGVIAFTNIAKDSAEIGLYAKPNLQGIGKTLMQSITEYGFNELKLSTLYSEVFEHNVSAIKLYKKFGFKEINKKENIIIMELKNENR